MSAPVQNPRKEFAASVDYAVSLARGLISFVSQSGKALDGLPFLEIGPGADFAPQLVIASMGARVTLADPYIARWDPDYHPAFYREFLNAWDGPKAAIEAALDRQGYDGILTCLEDPVAALSVPSGAFDFVYSNAVLEHVPDLAGAVAELARVTAPTGVHAHQIDFRHHRDFNRPLDHLLIDPDSFSQLRAQEHYTSGCSWRMPDFIDAFAGDFWIWTIERNGVGDDDYVRAIQDQLPADSPYRGWPRELMRFISGRVWLVRK